MRLLITLSVAALLAGATVSCMAALKPAPPAVTGTGVRFVMSYPEAKQVAVAGSFNQWSILSHPLSRRSNSGVWTTVVRLPPGEYLFMYVVDGGRWISPPHAEDFMDDGFGSMNGVLVVGPRGR